MSNKIVIAENIPYAEKAFKSLGDVEILSVKEITNQSIKDATALIVRSTTKVNKELLDGTKVGFVGTATIGTDHVDIKYLKEKNIEFANAAGSNANSVSEYITAALLLSAKKAGKPLKGSSIAIIGVGNVGTLVAQKAEALGMTCFLNDPPKKDETGDTKYLPLEEAVKNADYITCHVPLIKAGPYPTLNMIDKNFFKLTKKGVVFINSSRGNIVVEKDLSDSLNNGHVDHAILDVWNNEPTIDKNMFDQVFIGTSHIAGHSLDGKAKGTKMMFDALSTWFKNNEKFDLDEYLPKPEITTIDITNSIKDSDEDILREIVHKLYDIKKDHSKLKEIVYGENSADEFKNFRTNYPVRREFYNTTLILSSKKTELVNSVKKLGFKVKIGE